MAENTGIGYTCFFCGAFVLAGTTHICLGYNYRGTFLTPIYLWPALSDEDVERIAVAVVKKLREARPEKPRDAEPVTHEHYHLEHRRVEPSASEFNAETASVTVAETWRRCDVPGCESPGFWFRDDTVVRARCERCKREWQYDRRERFGADRPLCPGCEANDAT